MTATDELRRMLDERGVEWESCPHCSTYVEYKGEAWRFDYDEPFDQLAIVCLSGYTPAQAIEATLGRGTCHPVANDNLTESEGTGDAWADCSECGHLLCVLTDPSSQMPNYCPNCGRKVVRE